MLEIILITQGKKKIIQSFHLFGVGKSLMPQKQSRGNKLVS